jgi:RNA polymerase sigma-70 factor (ECF subfamily)
VAIVARTGLVPPLVSVAGPANDAGVALHARQTATITALYAEHGARIQRFLSDLLGDATLAADATQETFVRAYRKILDLDETARVAPWLFGIARNVSLELRKARYRASKRFVTVDGDVDAPTPSGSSPESEYLGREAVKVVGAALAKLPEERRAMLLLRLDHALPYDDIAVTMGCSLAKVKIEIFRAREVLRATMADYQRGGDAR